MTIALPNGAIYDSEIPWAKQEPGVSEWAEGVKASAPKTVVSHEPCLGGCRPLEESWTEGGIQLSLRTTYKYTPFKNAFLTVSIEQYSIREI